MTLFAFNWFYTDLEIFWKHFMLKLPPSSATQLGNNSITITYEVDVKVEVTNWLPGSVSG
jgi:hypothetical protein